MTRIITVLLLVAGCMPADKTSDCDQVWYVDNDGDGFGDRGETQQSCDQPDGFAATDDDCDDANPDRYPGNTEVCDGVISSCDSDVLHVGETDEDGDGFVACTGWVGDDGMSGGDCDDNTATVYPGATELCDGLDNACSGQVPPDELDGDGDGWVICEIDEGGWLGPANEGGGDCDDTNFVINPGAQEYCLDGVDRNCDGLGDDCRYTGAIDLATGSKFTGEDPYGDTDSNKAGASVAGVGDINGDGFDDLLVGAPYDGLLLYGSAYLLLGSAAGVPSGPLADHTKFTNEFDYDFTGLSVAGAGDVNNDGFDDILIGAPHYSTGRTYLLLGAAEGIGSMDLADADAIFTGDFADGSAGDQVAGAGDVNGDGFDDIVIGASFAAPNGMAYVVHGSADPADLSLENADTVLTGEFGMTGDAASGAGDIDGDGFADVLIGAYGHWQERGAAYLLLGSAGGIASDSLANADTVFTEAADGNNAGRSVSGAGDVNGDGYADTLVGSSADGGNRQGAAYINLGSAAGIPSLNLANSDTAITGVYTEDLAGDRVSEAGDLDGDGFDDIMVVQFSSMNQLFYTFDIDNAFIFYGAAIGIPSSTTAAADAVLAGEPISDVAAAGDVNGDGQPDLLIGAQHSDPYGAAFLLLGGAL